MKDEEATEISNWVNKNSDSHKWQTARMLKLYAEHYYKQQSSPSTSIKEYIEKEAGKTLEQLNKVNAQWDTQQVIDFIEGYSKQYSPSKSTLKHGQNLFETLDNVCGFTALDSDMYEILLAVRKDNPVSEAKQETS